MRYCYVIRTLLDLFNGKWRCTSSRPSSTADPPVSAWTVGRRRCKNYATSKRRWLYQSTRRHIPKDSGLSSVKNALSSCLKVKWIPCLRYMARLGVVGGWRRPQGIQFGIVFPVRNCSGGSDGTPSATEVVEMPDPVRQGWPTLGPWLKYLRPSVTRIVSKIQFVCKWRRYSYSPPLPLLVTCIHKCGPQASP